MTRYYTNYYQPCSLLSVGVCITAQGLRLVVDYEWRHRRHDYLVKCRRQQLWVTSTVPCYITVVWYGLVVDCEWRHRRHGHLVKWRWSGLSHRGRLNDVTSVTATWWNADGHKSVTVVDREWRHRRHGRLVIWRWSQVCHRGRPWMTSPASRPPGEILMVTTQSPW